MNENDIIRLNELNERYTPVNLTGFKLVTGKTDKGTVLKHFECDLNILSASIVENRRAVRVILRDDVIDICSFDNGTPVTYFFCGDAAFNPKDIKDEIEGFCRNFEVDFQN